LDRFRKQFIPDFPSEFTYDVQTGKPLNIKTLIKRASEFYRSKGTQNSFNFIFRILFDQDIQFYYPREHMFIVSGAKWTEKKTLKLIISPGDGRPRRLAEQTIYQLNDVGTQIASARVLSVTLYKQSPYDVAEMELVEIIGEFTDEYPILCDLLEEGATETLSYYATRGISNFTITNSGFSYKSGDRVFLEPIEGQNAQGVGFVGRVEETDIMGSIVKIVPVNFGINYEQNITGKYEVVVVSDTGSGFVGTAESSVLCGYTGYYENANGVLSERSFVQDNYYYQTHSYEIISSLPLETYYDVVKRVVHPAGYKMFGSQIVTQRMALQPTVQDYDTTITVSTSYYIGNYIAYRINENLNLRDMTLNGIPDIDLFPSGVNPNGLIPPDSDGYFRHRPEGLEETRDIGGAYFENFDFSSIVPDWDQRYVYWVVFPHPTVLINNTNGTNEQFKDLLISDLAVVNETEI
jgi:hypothetical protein